MVIAFLLFPALVALSAEELVRAASPLVGKPVVAEKSDGTVAVGTVVAATGQSVILRLRNDKLLELQAAEVVKFEETAPWTEPAEAPPPLVPPVLAPPTLVPPPAPAPPRMVDVEQANARAAARKTAEERRRRYRLEAEDLRAQAATERATAANQTNGAVGSCVASAAMAGTSLFVCGIPLLAGSVAAAGVAIYLFVMANTSTAAAANKEQQAAQKNEAAREAMEY
jgi:hypothetical protein